MGDKIPAKPTGERPIMFLDVDDTLLRCPPATPGQRPQIEAVWGAGAFLQWAIRHFEVWWLTEWFSGGEVDERGADDLSDYLYCEAELIDKIPAVQWTSNKAAHLDWEMLAGREWVWVEDGLEVKEIETLKEKQAQDRHIACNVTTNEARLQEVADLLAIRYGLPTIDLSAEEASEYI